MRKKTLPNVLSFGSVPTPFRQQRHQRVAGPRPGGNCMLVFFISILHNFKTGSYWSMHTSQQLDPRSALNVTRTDRGVGIQRAGSLLCTLEGLDTPLFTLHRYTCAGYTGLYRIKQQGIWQIARLSIPNMQWCQLQLGIPYHVSKISTGYI